MPDLQKILDVAVIVGPVFAIMALGRWLTRRGVLTPEISRFINDLALRFCLPSLILYEVGRGDLAQLSATYRLIGVPIGVMTLAMILFLWASRHSTLANDEKPAFVFGVFWGNIAYLGFPLAQSAFGASGLALAAIYNATVMPLTTLAGYLVIHHYLGSREDHPLARAREIICNPIVASALLGVLVMLLSAYARGPDGALYGGPAVTALFGGIGSFLKMLGGMGLPLALLVVGGSLRFTVLRAKLLHLTATAVTRTFLLPLLVYAIFALLPGDDAGHVRSVGVLLAAMPCSVSSFVIATGRGANARFTAAVLALSTAISLVTLPVWLYFLL